MNIDKLKQATLEADRAIRQLTKDGASAKAIAAAKEQRRITRKAYRDATKKNGASVTGHERGERITDPRSPGGGAVAGKAVGDPIEAIGGSADGAVSRQRVDIATGDDMLVRVVGPLTRQIAVHGVGVVLRALSIAIITAGKGSRAELETAWSVQRLAHEASK